MNIQLSVINDPYSAYQGFSNIVNGSSETVIRMYIGNYNILQLAAIVPEVFRTYPHKSVLVLQRQ